MPNILLMRLNAPMQSWGISSRFSIRDTAKEPSKSGVIGLLCAALGISRDEANTANNPKFKKLTELKMGVRVLSEGILQKDYHTAQEVAKADGGTKPTELSTRWFLADADFVIALKSEDFEFLNELQNALKNPRWQLFFGRKSFVPALPIYFTNGIFSTEKSLKDFLKGEEIERSLSEHQIGEASKRKPRRNSQRFIVEVKNESEIKQNVMIETVQDVPLDFGKRRFSLRRVRTEFFTPEKITGGNENGNLSDEDDFESAF